MSYKHTMSLPIYLTVMSMLWRSDKKELPENATLSTTINDIPRAMLAYDLNEITKNIASAAVCYGGSPKPEKLFSEVLIDYSEVQPQCIMSVAAGGVPLLNVLLERVRNARLDPGKQTFPNVETAEFYFWALDVFSKGVSAWNGTAAECLQSVTGNLLTAAEEKNALPRVIDDVRRLGQNDAGPLELKLTLTSGSDKGVRLTAVRQTAKPQENKEPPEVVQNREKLVEDAKKTYLNIRERILHCGYINCKNIPMHRAIRLAALAKEENGCRHIAFADLAAISTGLVNTPAAKMQLLSLLSSKTVSWASRLSGNEPRPEVKLFSSVIWDNDGIKVEVSDMLRPFFDEMASGVTMDLLRETREMTTPTASDLAVYLRTVYSRRDSGCVNVKLSSVKERMITIDPSADMCYQATILLPNVVQRINEEGTNFPFHVTMQCLNMTYNDASIRFTLTSKEEMLRSPLSRPKSASERSEPAAKPTAASNSNPAAPSASRPQALSAAEPISTGTVVSVQEVKSEPAPLAGICCNNAAEVPQSGPAAALSSKRNPFAENIGPNDAVSLSGYKVPLRVLLSQVRPESLIDVLFDKSADLMSAQTFWDAVSARENQVRNEGAAR